MLTDNGFLETEFSKGALMSTVNFESHVDGFGDAFITMILLVFFFCFFYLIQLAQLRPAGKIVRQFYNVFPSYFP